MAAVASSLAPPWSAAAPPTVGGGGGGASVRRRRRRRRACVLGLRSPCAWRRGVTSDRDGSGVPAGGRRSGRRAAARADVVVRRPAWWSSGAVVVAGAGELLSSRITNSTAARRRDGSTSDQPAINRHSQGGRVPRQRQLRLVLIRFVVELHLRARRRSSRRRYRPRLVLVRVGGRDIGNVVGLRPRQRAEGARLRRVLRVDLRRHRGGRSGCRQPRRARRPSTSRPRRPCRAPL